MSAVPVTPAVVAWAVERSGYTIDEIAAAVDAEPNDVRAWLKGTSQPNLGEARALAKKLKRPLAFLLWPEPPRDTGPAVAFRAPIGADLRELNATEQRYIRQATRLQAALHHICDELVERSRELPQFRISDNAAKAAEKVRTWLGASIEEQFQWSSPSVAFNAWRENFEKHDIFVFALPLGEGSCRGVTLASDRTPIIIINTAVNPRARIFTLFHELGHVVTRTTSACAASWGRPDSHSEAVERWCEEFAACALMPWADVAKFLSEKGWNGSLDHVEFPTAIARKFHVSLAAAALRLINAGRATWKLWNILPRTSNDKPEGGPPAEEPRTTAVVRLHEFGGAVPRILLGAAQKDIFDRSQVASFLRVDEWSLRDIETRITGSSDTPEPTPEPLDVDPRVQAKSKRLRTKAKDS